MAKNNGLSNGGYTAEILSGTALVSVTGSDEPSTGEATKELEEMRRQERSEQNNK